MHEPIGCGTNPQNQRPPKGARRMRNSLTLQEEFQFREGPGASVGTTSFLERYDRYKQ